MGEGGEGERGGREGGRRGGERGDSPWLEECPLVDGFYEQGAFVSLVEVGELEGK